jgi:hypothetical protein
VRGRLILWVALLSIGCGSDEAPPTPDPPPVVSASAAEASTTSSVSTPEPTGEAPVSSASAAPSARHVRAPATSASTAPTTSAEASASIGEKEDEASYAAWLEGSGRYLVNQPATVRAVLLAKGEYKVNENYPHKFKLGAAPDGVSYPNAMAGGATKGKGRAVVNVPFTASTPGNKTISGTFLFSVCNASSCKMLKRPLSVTVAVQER